MHYIIIDNCLSRLVYISHLRIIVFTFIMLTMDLKPKGDHMFKDSSEFATRTVSHREQLSCVGRDVRCFGIECPDHNLTSHTTSKSNQQIRFSNPYSATLVQTNNHRTLLQNTVYAEYLRNRLSAINIRKSNMLVLQTGSGETYIPRLV